MQCTQCGLTNPPGTSVCTNCNTPLPVTVATKAVTPNAGVSHGSDQTLTSSTGFSATSDATTGVTSFGPIQPGRVLGNRYEIVQLLGEGGMGAVYKARDRELDRLVALKVIRPNLAQSPSALHRFKQELILARQVTHRNVIRIFDLGEADGIKFITMEYIEGRDLKSMIRERQKFTPVEAAEIMEQVCHALEAAHREGVIHRDLKPQNIMVDEQGKVSVMDFGIARSMEADGGMTLTGALVGTPEYMSPEQAKGEKLDAQTDLFSLGIIFYELLTGNSPYKADTAMSSLYKRATEAARPPIELISDIPGPLNDIVVRCLEIDKTKRYSSATEILAELESWRGLRPGTVALPSWLPRRLRHSLSGWKWAAAGAFLLALALTAVVFGEKTRSSRLAKRSEPGELVALAILPFHNRSADLSMDWIGPSIADMLSTDVGQSAHMRTVSADRLHQILRDLRIPANADLDPEMLKRIAELSNADTVVLGQYAKFGDQIRIDATLLDLKRDRRAPLKIEAANENALPATVDGLAELIRKNLAVPSDVLRELKASSFQPTSKSVAALRDYNQGVQLLREGKNLEAVKALQATIQEDSQFALAYYRLAETELALGYDTDAERDSRKAVDLAENLPARGKYLIEASRARIGRDYPKAIKAYENLVATSPDDPDIQIALARLYEDTGDLEKARAHYSRVLTGDPKHTDVLFAMGRVEIKSANPQGALDYFNRGLTLAVQLENEEARASMLQGTGVAYRQLNRQGEALRYFEQSLEIKRRLGDKRGIAVSLNTIAQIQTQMGKSGEALKGYMEALRLRREIGDKKGTGDTLIDLGTFYNYGGHYDEALKYFKESLQIQRELGSESNQGLCLNNIGTCYLSRGDYENAFTYFQQALELRERSKVPGDIALTVHNLAQTTLKLGQYDKALSYSMRALELNRSAGDKYGAAIESYGMGTLFGYQGRYGAALKAEQEALNTFRELQDRSYWMTEISSGYGMALADAGRFDEAQKSLDEALALARGLKIDGSIAQALDGQGLCAFYRSDFKSAKPLFEQALQVATRSKEQERVLLSRFHLATVTLKQGRAVDAVSSFRKLASEADTLGLKYLSLQSAVYLGESLLKMRDYKHAREELERVASRAEKLELRAVLAQDQYLLATALRLSGNATEATSHYRAALRYLDEIRKDTGSDAVLQRSDLNPIYSESSRRSESKAE